MVGVEKQAHARQQMATFSTNEFKSGLKLMVDGDPCSIIENEFVKPGKGQAFSRVKLRNLLTGRVVERTYKSGESLDGADVVELDLQYLYSDGEYWHFMNAETYEQYAVSENNLADAAKWLKEEDVCLATLWNNEPISFTPPNFVVLRVSDTEPGLRGNTATGATKAATLETGAVVQVPLFVETDERLRIDTRTGEYVSRVKD